MLIAWMRCDKPTEHGLSITVVVLATLSHGVFVCVDVDGMCWVCSCLRKCRKH